MPQLTPAALRKQIAAETLDPLYMLVGDDDAEKSAVANEFADMIDEGLRAFNVDRLYGGDTKVDDVIQASATLPMNKRAGAGSFKSLPAITAINLPSGDQAKGPNFARCAKTFKALPSAAFSKCSLSPM